MSNYVDFITGVSPQRVKKKSKKLNLCYSSSKSDDTNIELVLQKSRAAPRSVINNNPSIEDGLYVPSAGPLTYTIIKPYQLDHNKTIAIQKSPKSNTKLLEIAVRDVKINNNTTSKSQIKISSVQILFKEKIICKIPSPFNRKLYKLLVSNSFDPTNLLIKIQTQNNYSSILPFPLPHRCVHEKKIEIDFSIKHNEEISSGTVICTISLSTKDEDSPQPEPSSYSYKSTNDPNDPQNCLSLLKTKKNLPKKSVDYFLLEDPALHLETLEDLKPNFTIKERKKIPEVVVLEQPAFSLWDLSIGSWLESSRPLRPSSASNTLKLRSGKDDILTITILRGVEVPVREETSLVQPIVQIQWGELIESTTAAEGASPVWQQTLAFGLPKNNQDTGVKLSLFDQHPVWGLQWLGEAMIPLEFHQNNQELERWVGLSPLSSPVIRFGYNQNNQTRAYTRIYILMRMERLINCDNFDINSLDVLAKAVQRCMAVPYKIEGIETVDDAGRLAMLLAPLPGRYGPLTPRQAIKLNKVDHYGRAALLATLFQGLGVNAFVIIGNSQARKWAAFVLTLEDKMDPVLWEPENGDQYGLGDSRCSLIKVTRLVSHQNIWKNLQKTTIPSNLRFNNKIAKDWQPLGNNSSVSRESQVLESRATESQDNHLDIENQLKDMLSQWRSGMGFTTVFNRHAASVLRGFLTKLSSKSDKVYDKKDLKQLYRAYHAHGFVLKLRCIPVGELIELFKTTRIQEVTGAVEFALVCHLQKYVCNTSSLLLAIVVLRSRD